MWTWTKNRCEIEFETWKNAINSVCERWSNDIYITECYIYFIRLSVCVWIKNMHYFYIINKFVVHFVKRQFILVTAKKNCDHSFMRMVKWPQEKTSEKRRILFFNKTKRNKKKFIVPFVLAFVFFSSFCCCFDLVLISICENCLQINTSDNNNNDTFF